MSLNSNDIEKRACIKEHQVGFADFAEYIASDGELSLYKGFHSIAARNLLYMQAELQVLSHELLEMEEEDKQSMSTTTRNDEKRRGEIDKVARAWEGIQEQCELRNEREMRRMKLIRDVRKLMKEYEKALLRRSQVLALESPNNGTLEAFTNWFRFKKPLRGLGWNLLDNEEDLVALKPSADPDRLTFFIQNYFGWYLRVIRDDQPPSWGPMYYFKSATVSRIVTLIATLLAASFLIGAIVILYWVRPLGARLGIVAAFTASFAGTVGLLTNAKRVEIFAATAAYAAALVVFVSGDIANS